MSYPSAPNFESLENSFGDLELTTGNGASVPRTPPYTQYDPTEYHQYDDYPAGNGYYTAEPESYHDRTYGSTQSTASSSMANAGSYEVDSYRGYGDIHYVAGSSRGSASTAAGSSSRHSRSSRGFSGTSASSVSTAPSIRNPRPNLNTQISQQGPAQQRYQLPCEFMKLTGCSSVFTGDDDFSWKIHIESHLESKFPAKAMCWFCDNWVFDSEKTSGGDRRANFETRLDHIREHFLEGKQAADMRPDYHILKHVRHHDMASRQAYDYWLGHSEAPKLPPAEDWDLGEVETVCESKPAQKRALKKKERESKKHSKK